MSTETPTNRLMPHFASAQAAKNAGFHLITSFYEFADSEREMAERALDNLDGTQKWCNKVRFAIVGNDRRVAFARPLVDLVGINHEPRPQP